MITNLLVLAGDRAYRKVEQNEYIITKCMYEITDTAAM